jgi:hypothetical protein
MTKHTLTPGPSPGEDAGRGVNAEALVTAEIALERTEAAPLSRWLAERSENWQMVYGAACAFAVYFCMYAFRKPYTAGSFAGLTFWESGLTLKTALVVGQIAGYATSKWLGIKVCSETGPGSRRRMLLRLILFAEAALVLFAAVPVGFKPAAMFLNGLPLGMVFGLVVPYLEGRRRSDVMLACLCSSFVLAGGVVKDLGVATLAAGVSELWMPAVVGAAFLIPLFLSSWLLDQLPPPRVADEEHRHARTPMTSADRWSFMRRYGLGLAPLFVVYLLLTAMRDYRDNFGVELLKEVGAADQRAAFTRMELPIALCCLAMLAGLNVVGNNRRALLALHGIIAGGCAVVLSATWLHEQRTITGFQWLALTGLGSYLAYVAFNAAFFERLMAVTRAPGTAVFGIYVADALGYVGSIGLQIGKDWFAGGSTRAEFFGRFTWTVGTFGIIAALCAAAFFATVRPVDSAHN